MLSPLSEHSSLGLKKLIRSRIEKPIGEKKMAKTTVSTLTSDIKLIVDYNISDDDLDSLILKGINFAIKRSRLKS